MSLYNIHLEKPTRHLRVNLKSDGCYFMVLLGILTLKTFRNIILRNSVRFDNSDSGVDGWCQNSKWHSQLCNQHVPTVTMDVYPHFATGDTARASTLVFDRIVVHFLCSCSCVHLLCSVHLWVIETRKRGTCGLLKLERGALVGY